jgi:AAA+ superfamily predicted ATPase
MTTWFARFSYEIEFEAADANEADEVMQRVVDADTVFGLPVTARSQVFIARRDSPAATSNQDDAPAKRPT